MDVKLKLIYLYAIDQSKRIDQTAMYNIGYLPLAAKTSSDSSNTQQLRITLFVNLVILAPSPLILTLTFLPGSCLPSCACIFTKIKVYKYYRERKLAVFDLHQLIYCHSQGIGEPGFHPGENRRYSWF